MEPLLAHYPELHLYEVPTIYESSALFRLWLNNGMCAGITDQASRRRTVTIYVDREQFNTALSIPDTRDVHLLLLNAEDRIAWRNTGPANDEKLADLSRALVSDQSPMEIAWLSQAPTGEGASVREGIAPRTGSTITASVHLCSLIGPSPGAASGFARHGLLIGGPLVSERRLVDWPRRPSALRQHR